jgi:long-chain acyl-CoA synthetase
VQALYEAIVTEVNQNLAQYETIKHFVLVPDEFTIADGQLTPSMKMRRRAVEQRYRVQIEALYSSTAAPEGGRGAKGPRAEPVTFVQREQKLQSR